MQHIKFKLIIQPLDTHTHTHTHAHWTESTIQISIYGHFNMHNSVMGPAP
jgi:hypothetical protein